MAEVALELEKAYRIRGPPGILPGPWISYRHPFLSRERENEQPSDCRAERGVVPEPSAMDVSCLRILAGVLLSRLWVQRERKGRRPDGCCQRTGWWPSADGVQDGLRHPSRPLKG